MKIGIISEFNTRTVNYGNHLQAYALNRYLTTLGKAETVHSIELRDNGKWVRTGMFSFRFAKKAIGVIKDRIFFKKKSISACEIDLSKRKRAFARFREKHIPMNSMCVTSEDLQVSDYDAYVVGSDVVWGQIDFKINQTKFLAFNATKSFKRISYAASFARDYIPKENIRLLRKYLNEFDAVSVRERSSVDMLRGIGVQNVSYCLDPTLLLSVSEWEAMENRPQSIGQDEAYVFVYLLGKEQSQRTAIIDYARRNCLKTVTVPHADGVYHEVDELFGDVQLNDCSIENWIWLIHHAHSVITDSFHGLVFATIFKRPFLVLERQYSLDINNRIYDYLQEIGQSDKLIAEQKLPDVSDVVWDYVSINREIDIRRNASVKFLNDALEKIRAK